jgi:putative acetyltransferase
MIIRPAMIDDAQGMKELHDRAVMELCKDDYTLDQLIDWVSKSPLEKYVWRLERQRIFIAEIEEQMVGFVRWLPDEKMLCSICVEPAFARQGIATQLMKYVYKDARILQVADLWLEASLTAIPFYESLGWEQTEELIDDALQGMKMVKLL